MIVLFFLVVQQQSKDLQNALKKKSFPATLKAKVVTEPEFKYLARYDSHLLSILDIFPQMIIILIFYKKVSAMWYKKVTTRLKIGMSQIQISCEYLLIIMMIHDKKIKDLFINHIINIIFLMNIESR